MLNMACEMAYAAARQLQLRTTYIKSTSILALLALTTTLAWSSPPQSFGEAKHVAAAIYADYQTSFYCGCSYTRQGNKLVPDLDSCGYIPRKELERASRIEWEHVVPAWAFGHQLQCWQNGGRKNCRATSEKFRLMEADLRNLVPAIGEINGNRSNYSFAMLEGEPRVYGSCDFEVDFKGRKAEPAASVRGDIARIYFYMRDNYGLSISDKQRKLFAAWDRDDPVDEWELERGRRIDEMLTGRALLN